MQHDERLGRPGTHRNEAVFERLGRVADPQSEQIAVVGFQRCCAGRQGSTLVGEFEMVKEAIRLALLINCGIGNFAGAIPGEDDLGSDGQPQEVARDPSAAGSRQFVTRGQGRFCWLLTSPSVVKAVLVSFNVPPTTVTSSQVGG